jgi:hypothetical protein
MDYIEGGYTKDPVRMERALHPQLIKRRIGIDSERKQSYRDVTILDLYGNAATVKIDADDWVDYLHIVKWNGKRLLMAP